MFLDYELESKLDGYAGCLRISNVSYQTLFSATELNVFILQFC